VCDGVLHCGASGALQQGGVKLIIFYMKLNRQPFEILIFFKKKFFFR
jgi:hypothetical protein